MKKWQEERNYWRVRDEQGNVIANIISVDGVDVEVSEEVFLAYSQADRKERYSDEVRRKNESASLNQLVEEDHIPLEDLGIEPYESAEVALIKKEQHELVIGLLKNVNDLSEKDRDLIWNIYFDELSIREYARRLGVSDKAIRNRRDRILKKIKKFF